MFGTTGSEPGARPRTASSRAASAWLTAMSRRPGPRRSRYARRAASCVSCSGAVEACSVTMRGTPAAVATRAATAPSGMPTWAWTRSNGHRSARAVANGTSSAAWPSIATGACVASPACTAGRRATGTPAPQWRGVETAAAPITARRHAATAWRATSRPASPGAWTSAFSQEATTTSIPSARRAATSSLTKLPRPGSSCAGYHRATTSTRRGRQAPAATSDGEPPGGAGSTGLRGSAGEDPRGFGRLLRPRALRVLLVDRDDVGRVALGDDPALLESRIARLQNSVTQFMSWVTKTTALAAAASSRTRALLLARKTSSPVARTSSSSRMSGSTEVAIEKPSRARIPDEYVLIGASMNWPMSAKSMIPCIRRRHLRVLDPQERPGQADVVATGQLLVEAGAQGEQARHQPVDVDPALGRRDDPGQHLEERALAGAVGPDDGQRFAVDQVEADVPQGPERPIAVAAAPKRLTNDRLQRRLAGEAQAVLDPEVADVDRVWGPGPAGIVAGHHSTFANDGSTRLNKSGGEGEEDQRDGAEDRRPPASPRPSGAPAPCRRSRRGRTVKRT